MIHLLDGIAFIIEWIYVFVFFWILHTFLPVRNSWLLRIPALICCSFLAVVIVYSNDFANLFGSLVGFAIYLAIFHKGRWVEKLTAVLIFYPSIIAINYIMQDVGARLFFGLTDAPNDSSRWPDHFWLLSTAIHTIMLLIRLIFWSGAWVFLRKYLRNTTYTLTNQMWLIVDTLMLASVVSIFTIIYFMPRQMIIVYPICAASIFSSFGCIYLASYMCSAMQTAWHAQELEMRQNYYEEKMEDEMRIRRIYHDMKNHLLVLENNDDVHTSIAHLQKQMEPYENYYKTGNPYLDVLIRDKAKVAREKKIDFTAVIHFADGDFLDPLDISTLFGNALDNAIEASEKLSVSRRVVTVKARHIHDMLVIAVENNTLLEANLSEKTSKKDTFFHGFGLSNIKNIVEKYEGECLTTCEDGVFSLKIILPIPSSS